SHLSAGNSITAGSDGNLWFTYSHGIRRITPAGTITEFALPSPGTPGGIAAGSDGNVWFTDAEGNRIGVLAPQIARASKLSMPHQSRAGVAGRATCRLPRCPSMWPAQTGLADPPWTSSSRGPMLRCVFE